MKKKSLLFPMPQFCLHLGALLLGKRSLSQRLMGSLQVDINKTKNLLGWKPIVSIDEALLRTAEAFLDNKS